MIIKNNKRAFKVFKGNSLVDRIYKGTDKVYEYLPVGYKECKYIEASGTQYIKSNYKPNSNTKIEIDFSIPSTYPAFMCIYGTQDSGSSNRFYCGISLTNYRFQVNFTNTSSFYGLNEDDTISPNVNGTFSSVAGNMKVVIDNGNTQVKSNKYTNTYSMSSVSGWGNITCSYNLVFFGRNTADTVGNHYYGKLYSCKIYETNLVRNFIPCLDDNNEPCLYDTVTKTTFYNHGSGTFTYELL